MLLTLTLIASVIGCYVALDYVEVLKEGWYWGLVVIEFALLFIMSLSKKVNDNLTFKTMLLYVFTFINGATLSVVIDAQLGAGNGALVMSSIMITAGLFGLLSFFALITKTDFTSIGGYLFVVLIALIIGLLVNIFLESSILETIISIIGVILFSVFIIHDTQNIVKGNISPIDSVISLYLDIINLFLMVLNLGDD